MQKGPAGYDVPHHFSLSAVTQIPGGKSGPRLVRKFIGGWQSSVIVQQQSGRPWNLPTNILYVKDAALNIDWSKQVVQAVTVCLAQVNNNGTMIRVKKRSGPGRRTPNGIIVPAHLPAHLPNPTSST